MASRPLRQHYVQDGRAPVSAVIDPALGPVVAPWRAQRVRFLAALRELDPADWDHATRCAQWSVREVVGHLVVVDGFWPLSFAAARDAAPLTTYLAGFDPSSAPTGATPDMAVADLLDGHAAKLAALDGFVASFDDEAWDRRCESPLGHLPARGVLAHALWDSWLHEYDIFEPIGRAPAIVPDELFVATWFSLWFAGLQGGLVDDPDAVGPGPGAPIDVCLAFSDLPGRPIHLQVGTVDNGVHIAPCPRDHEPVAAGLALGVVEAMTGRRSTDPAFAALPPDVAAQLRRAAQVL